jgi:putative ABC transport system permease protein
VSLIELVRLSLQRLAASRLRSALTMLGVIIGVAAVVAVVAVGQGTGQRISSQISSLGTNLLTVTAGGSFSGLVRGAAGSATTLTQADAAAIGGLAQVSAVAPEATSQSVISSGTKNVTTNVVGTTAAYAAVRSYAVWQGSFLTSPSDAAAMRVAVLGYQTASDLGITAADLNGEISIGGLPFKLVGLLQPKGGAGAASADDQVLIPLATFEHYIRGGVSVRTISVSVANGADTTRAGAVISELLRQRHQLSASQPDDFSVTSQQQLLDVAQTVSGTLTLLLVGIGSISLLVGGIGIMNIMLVSVRERTREIGIRKAVGAKRGHILAQFLVEAVVLSALGGLIGVALGLAASFVIGQAAGWGFVFSPITVVVAIAFSGLVGIVFGVWPARQAARLDPIVALRYE